MKVVKFHPDPAGFKSVSITSEYAGIEQVV